MNSIGEKGNDYLEPLNMKPAGEDPPEPEPAPSVVPDKEGKTREVHRAVFLDLCGRICRKEAKAIRHALKKPDTFNTVVERFYMTHGDYVKATLAPSVTVYVVAINGDTSKLDGYLDSLAACLRSQEQILNTPVGVVHQEIPSIEKNASWWADKIINDWSNHAGN